MKLVILAGGHGTRINEENSLIFQKLQFKEKKFLKLSSSAILKDINFSSKLNMGQTIKLTSDWYSMFFKNKSNIFDFTKKEILSFFKSKY